MLFIVCNVIQGITQTKEPINEEEILELLKSKTAQEVLNIKSATLYNLGNEEMVHEDYDGKQILSISDSLARLDKDLKAYLE